MTVIDLAAVRRARAIGSPGIIRPHRPDDRIVAETICVPCHAVVFGYWEVRIFDPAGQFHHYFASRALLHVQLWNPFFGVSILSPSRLTGFNYESFPLNEWKYASPDYDDIAERLRAHIGIRLPNASFVRRICRTYVGEPARMQAQAVMPARTSTPLVR